MREKEDQCGKSGRGVLDGPGLLELSTEVFAVVLHESAEEELTGLASQGDERGHAEFEVGWGGAEVRGVLDQLVQGDQEIVDLVSSELRCDRRHHEEGHGRLRKKKPKHTQIQEMMRKLFQSIPHQGDTTDASFH